MSVNWKRGTTPVSELTLENFGDFARDFAHYTYMLCFKATLDEKQAVTLSANALAAVACQESGKEGSDTLMPEEAIKRSLLDVLNKQQLAQLNNDDIKTDKQPEEKTLDAIVDKAINIANANMPRYARVFSGTKGTLVILGLVAVLMAAIIFIWVNPSACNAVAQITSSGQTGDVDSAARPDTDMLINVNFDDSGAERINSGVYPVVFTVDGPDSRSVTSVTVLDSQGIAQQAYPCGEYKYCFMASNSDVYQTVIGSQMGEMSAYCIVPPMEKPEDINSASHYVVSHNNTVMVTIAEGGVLSAAPAKGTLEETIGGYIYSPLDSAEGIGLDSFSYTRADGTVCTVPVLVSNSTPYIDPECLTASVRHTPSRAGVLAGRIISEDADGDQLAFTLTGATGCSAMISPDGSYIVLIEPEYRLGEAEFSFTVSDGIIESEPYTVSVNLANGLIAASEMNQNFVCYSGEDGYYEFELPAADDDGDKLTWSLVTENSNGLTLQWGSEVLVRDGNVVRYRIDPTRNENFVEVLTFACSDGWMSGTLMTVICNNSANRPPVSSGQNFATIEAGASDKMLEVSVNNDCVFDRCVITSVDEVQGGSVKNETGWEDMKFCFTHDGETEHCSARVTVSDSLTGQSVQILYDIVVQ